MSTKRGQLNCSTNRKNVGFGSCVLDWKLIKGALYYDSARSFTDDELLDLRTLLEAEAAKDIKSSRMFPIHNFLAPTDNTEDLIIQTFDYGPKLPVREGDNDWMFQFYDGGACLNAALRSHNGKGYVLFYDKEYKIMGTKINNKFATIPLQFMYTKPWGLPTGSTVAAYMIRFVFESKYVNEQGDFIKADFDLSEITGLQDIEVVVNTFDQDSGDMNVTLQTKCGGVNLFDSYSDKFSTTSIAFKDEDGNEVTFQSITPVTGSKTFDIQLDPADFPDSGIVTGTGAAPSAMATAEIEGYEIETFELTIEGS